MVQMEIKALIWTTQKKPYYPKLQEWMGIQGWFESHPAGWWNSRARENRSTIVSPTRPWVLASLSFSQKILFLLSLDMAGTFRYTSTNADHVMSRASNFQSLCIPKPSLLPQWGYDPRCEKLRWQAWSETDSVGSSEYGSTAPIKI